MRNLSVLIELAATNWFQRRQRIGSNSNSLTQCPVPSYDLRPEYRVILTIMSSKEKFSRKRRQAAKLRRVSFAPLREKINCDLPAFFQSERRETELLPPFETQMFVPSKMTLQGDLPTLNVLTIVPRRGSICATELLP